MPSKARVYILDELRDAQTQSRKQPMTFAIQPDNNHLVKLVSRNNSKECVEEMLLPADNGALANKADQEKEESVLTGELSCSFQECLSGGSMTVDEERSLHEFCVKYTNSLFSEPFLHRVACRAAGASNRMFLDNVGKLLRNPRSTREEVNVALHPDFMRVFNPLKLYCKLSEEFGMGKSFSLRLGRSRSVNVSLKSVIYQTNVKKIPKRLRRLMGMIVFVNPSADTHAIECCIKTRYHTKTRTVEQEFPLCGDGNTYAYQLTDAQTARRTEEVSDERRKSRSLPGWNTRVPIFLPSQQVDFKLKRVTGKNKGAGQGAACSGPDTLGNLAFFRSMSARGSQSNEAFAMSGGTDDPATREGLPESPYYCPTAPGTPGQCAQGESDLKITLTAYPCLSLEDGLERTLRYMQLMRNTEVATMTLPGKISALHLASLHGNIEAVQRILECGGNVNLVNGPLNYTPLHEAVMGGHHHLIAVLLENRADQSLCDIHGWTPLHLACWNNDIATARVLMRHATVRKAMSAKDKHGRTPNRLCARRHIRDSVEACMKANDIPVRKEQWWNSLSNSAMERTDGRRKQDKNAIFEYIINARMRGRPPQDSDYY